VQELGLAHSSCILVVKAASYIETNLKLASELKFAVGASIL
jgi:hypothetical protein